MQTLQALLQPWAPELISTREPGGTRLGELLRAYLKADDTAEPLDPRAELLLFYAARVQLLQRVIRPALQRGAWVLADRFEWSSFAYQGGGRQLDEAVLQQLSAFCVQDNQPDLTLFLNVDPALGLQRVLQRGGVDRIEQESLVFFERVQAAYLRRLQSTDRVLVIDANQPLELVQASIRTAVTGFFRVG